MIRWLLVLFALFGSLTAATAAPRDWSTVTTRTAAGTFVVGNPNAKVKLVEYLSYTCPHCAAFTRESAAILKGQMIKSGSTSIEYRNSVHERIDLAAALLARCAGTAGFAGATEAMFANQNDWYPRAYNYEQINAARLADYPVLARLRAIALGSGLAELVRGRWLTAPAFDACFADQAGLDALVRIDADPARPGNGTPAFLINGKPVPGSTWAALEKPLRAAGAR